MSTKRRTATKKTAAPRRLRRPATLTMSDATRERLAELAAKLELPASRVVDEAVRRMHQEERR